MLRDHFYPPLAKQHSWDALHGAWPTMMVMQLNARLPSQFVAAPSILLRSHVDPVPFHPEEHSANLAGQPTLAVETELIEMDMYGVQIYDVERDRRLVAAIEIVSPSNKDRPESRQVFVGRCEGLLRQGVSVAVVDVVTEKHFNLYTDLLDLVGQRDPAFEPEPPAIYAASCRWVPKGRKHVLETWSHLLHLEKTLPTLPIWIAENFAVSLDLEASYEDACRALRIS